MKFANQMLFGQLQSADWGVRRCALEVLGMIDSSRFRSGRGLKRRGLLSSTVCSFLRLRLRLSRSLVAALLLHENDALYRNFSAFSSFFRALLREVSSPLMKAKICLVESPFRHKKPK